MGLSNQCRKCGKQFEMVDRFGISDNARIFCCELHAKLYLWDDSDYEPGPTMRLVPKVFTVRDLNEPFFSHLIYVYGDMDIQAIKEYGGAQYSKYDSFFVSIENGDYTEIWGMEGTIAFLNKTVYRLK